VRFSRYPKREAYEVTPRKSAAARRAILKQKDRYPLFPELLKHQTAEQRLAAIAVERESWWQDMRNHPAQQWRRARRSLRELSPGPRAAISRYWQMCGLPGDPVYLLGIIHEHKARKVCFWHVMAELRRIRLKGLPAGRIVTKP
jgi:hypothetical protein